MKMSNKLLLGGFLLLVFLISAIHISLYAKYKSGDYTLYHSADELSQSLQSFPNILFVSIQNVPAASLRFSATAQVEKQEEEGIRVTQKGDTLLITRKAGQDISHFPLSVFVPHNATISVINSSVVFSAGKDDEKTNSAVYLKKSVAHFSGRQTRLQLGRLNVNISDSSTVTFSGNTSATDLQVRIRQSSFTYTGAASTQLRIATDSLSTLTMPSGHLLRAIIQPIPTQ